MSNSPKITAEKAAYNVESAAQLLSIGRTTLYACMKAGQLRKTKIGRKTLILAKDIDAFVELLQKKEELR